MDGIVVDRRLYSRLWIVDGRPDEAVLLIGVKVHVEPYQPAGGTAWYSDGRTRQLVGRWPPGKLGQFKAQFQFVAQTWSNSLRIVPIDGQPADLDPTYDFVYALSGIRCQFVLEFVQTQAEAQCRLLALHVPPHAQQKMESRIDYRPDANKAQLDGVLVSSDAYSATGQSALLRAIGRYLGIDPAAKHALMVNAGQNQSADAHDFMMGGMMAQPWHAWPWLLRLYLHAPNMQPDKWKAQVPYLSELRARDRADATVPTWTRRPARRAP